MRTDKPLLRAIFLGVVVGVLCAALAHAGVPLSSDVQKTAGPITNTTPVVTNFASLSGVNTLVTGAGSVNLAYRIINEDATNAIRCEYGSITNTAPTTTPTTSAGFAILATTTYWEVVAPNNRLDCIPAAGSPSVSVTIFPK